MTWRAESCSRQARAASTAGRIQQAARDKGERVSDERGSDLKYGHGSALWKYWTKGEGFAKWSGAVHKWTTLRDLLLKAASRPPRPTG